MPTSLSGRVQCTVQCSTVLGVGTTKEVLGLPRICFASWDLSRIYLGLLLDFDLDLVLILIWLDLDLDLDLIWIWIWLDLIWIWFDLARFALDFGPLELS